MAPLRHPTGDAFLVGLVSSTAGPIYSWVISVIISAIIIIIISSSSSSSNLQYLLEGLLSCKIGYSKRAFISRGEVAG
jgi:hypothetical protein